MIALGGPKLKQGRDRRLTHHHHVSMIALGGPKLKLKYQIHTVDVVSVSMIALGGPKLKHENVLGLLRQNLGFNDSTGWA